MEHILKPVNLGCHKVYFLIRDPPLVSALLLIRIKRVGLLTRILTAHIIGDQ
jgi:hypothetical protein